jgi:hypothetical protein
MLRHRPKMPDRAPLLDRSARLAAKNQRVTIEGIVARHEQMMLVSKGEQCQLVLQPWRRPPMRLRLRPWSQ